ncbi:ribosome-binding protein 1 [Anopheles nili]|uniref:ribosome-binding protein 1 n=1 Tax=Anopheles nili TaxID=185578 RepID=UPI00237ADE04|nr:ribosome-binding protein 1 [Anopheles nili]
MDLNTLWFIVIVLIFSLLSMLFISRFLPNGKSFEEMLKEKREMREKILGLTSPAPAAAPTKSNKESANKRTKKTHSTGGNANQNQKNRTAKQQQQQQRVEVLDPESDGNSSESPLEEEINPLTYGAKKRVGQATNLTVEYAETEPFPLSDNAGSNKKKDNKQQQSGKKNKQKSTGGILVNKTEPVLVKSVESVPEMNHFAEIHPKDALEIARQQKHEEEAKSGKHQQPKEQRQQSKNKKEHQSKLSPKGTAAVNAAEQQQQHSPVAVVHVAEVKKQSNADNNKIAAAALSAQKDKANKRKKNELITQELTAEMADVANVHSLVNILNKADLPRNDIQILIDFLLNKQQDTLAKDPSEWNDPSDPLQKLKKQLQEKETALLEEQQAAAGLQLKLKELRLELNSEKVQTGAALKGYVEELHNKKHEVLLLTQELNTFKEKTMNEKQTLSMQFQQLQAKYIQLSKEHASTQDHGSTIAQLNNDLQLLQQKLMAKSQLLNEKLQSEEEMMKKKTEYEILLHNNDELMRQRVQELTAYENDLRQLRLELSQKDELNQTCQQQSYEIEQLKAELQAKQKQAVVAATAAAAAAHANNQVDESNRVEIRNLQNALDSTKSKLEVFRNELVECKSQMTDYKQQTNELKAKEEQLQKQLEEQRQKNDSLRTKNWKLVEALQDSERRRGQMTSAGVPEKVEQQQKLAATNAEKVDVGKVILEEQNRTKDLLVQLLQPTGVVSALPVDATDFQSWLMATVGCIKERCDQLQRTHTTSNTNSSSSTSGASVPVAANSHPEPSSGTANSNSNSDSSRSNSSSNIIANNNLNTNNSVNSSLHETSLFEDVVVVVTNKNGTSDSGSEDEQQAMAQRYEQMQKTVDQYKTIIADTENMLKNLEAKVIEQDVHWRTVVQAKDKELSLLKSAGAVGQ